MKLSTFITRHQITLSSTPTTHNPHLPGEEGAAMSHWRCTLRCGGRSMRVVTFSMGSTLQGPPEVETVLDCLASDARADLSSFAAWCSEYGYDEDSRSALRTYNAVRRQSADLERLLGASDYRFLLDRVESL